MNCGARPSGSSRCAAWDRPSFPLPRPSFPRRRESTRLLMANQVLKGLSYREQTILDRPLRPEVQHFTTPRRIAAILLLEQ